MKMYLQTMNRSYVLDAPPAAPPASATVAVRAAHTAMMDKRKKESQEACNVIVQSLGPDQVSNIMDMIANDEPAMTVWNELKRFNAPLPSTETMRNGSTAATERTIVQTRHDCE